MVKSSGKSRSRSRVSKRSRSAKGGKRTARKSVRKAARKSSRKTARKSSRKTARKSAKGGKRKRVVRKTIRKRVIRKTMRKRMKGGRVALPTEYFGGNSGRYFDKPSTSYKTRHGASVGRSHGSGKVTGFRGTGPNLAPGMGGGKRVRKNKKIHRRTKKSKSRFSRK
tara:strand:+ start:395 stop:895 length:501 start_codon:yes stop_codon:yes gene_type:complete